MKAINLLFLIISSCCTFYGCMSSGTASSSRLGRNAFETFYVGKDGVQYYIKPLMLSNENSAEDIYLDFTFRYNHSIKDSATINFSILSSSLYRSIDSLVFSSGASNIQSEKVYCLFNEKTKQGYKSRFSTIVALSDVKELFDNDAWDLVVYIKNNAIPFKPGKRTRKTIRLLHDEVFILMNK